MQRLLLVIVVVLAALLLARDPYVEEADAFFLDWLLRNNPASGYRAPLTVVEIGSGPSVERKPNQQATGNCSESGTSAGAASPLGLAIFLHAMPGFEPSVVGVESFFNCL